MVNTPRFRFLQDVDYVCISDNYWLGTTKPCLTYGLRGICYFFLEVKKTKQGEKNCHLKITFKTSLIIKVECASADLHSGIFGGTVHEGMADLIAMMNTLVDKDGNILVREGLFSFP